MLQSDWVERPPARGMTIPVATIPTIIVSSWILSEACWTTTWETNVSIQVSLWD